MKLKRLIVASLVTIFAGFTQAEAQFPPYTTVPSVFPAPTPVPTFSLTPIDQVFTPPGSEDPFTGPLLTQPTETPDPLVFGVNTPVYSIIFSTDPITGQCTAVTRVCTGGSCVDVTLSTPPDGWPVGSCNATSNTTLGNISTSVICDPNNATACASVDLNCLNGCAVGASCNCGPGNVSVSCSARVGDVAYCTATMTPSGYQFTFVVDFGSLLPGSGLPTIGGTTSGSWPELPTFPVIDLPRPTISIYPELPPGTNLNPTPESSPGGIGITFPIR